MRICCFIGGWGVHQCGRSDDDGGTDGLSVFSVFFYFVGCRFFFYARRRFTMRMRLCRKT